jgi:hypothetical protein
VVRLDVGEGGLKVGFIHFGGCTSQL